MNTSISLETYYVVGVVYIVLFLLFAAKKPKIALALVSPAGQFIQRLCRAGCRQLADFNLTMAFAVFASSAAGCRQAHPMGPISHSRDDYLVICGISSISDWQGEATAVAFLQMVPYFVFSIILFSSYGTLEDVKLAFYLLVGIGLFFVISRLRPSRPIFT